MSEYLHGYTREEQNRLIDQAKILEPIVYRGIEFPERAHVLEVGCGVGGQTRILLRRFPSIRITGVDAEAGQLARAKEISDQFPDRLQWVQARADALPFAPASFDGAFICWVLEHIPEPEAAVRAIRKVLKPGAPIFVTEVFNPLFQFRPNPAGTSDYWNRFNAFQQELGGDPEIGLRLGNLFSRAGFDVELHETRTEIHDGKNLGERDRILKYLYGIFQSALPQMIAGGRATEADRKTLESDLEKALNDPDFAFVFGFIHIRARAPR